MKVLIYGYGNPGRQDDGAGITATEELERWAAENDYDEITFDSNYQLNAEDALAVSEADTVIFIDAAASQERSFLFRKIEAGGSITFSTHSLSPESVLALCGELYNKCPEAYMMTIRAQNFGVNEPVTERARNDAKAAADFLRKYIEEMLDKK